jgi:hypothetical protein
MSGPSMRITKDVAPQHLLEILKLRLAKGAWSVRVGLPDDENEAAHRLSESTRKKLAQRGFKTISLAELGAILEFGTARIPPRPFLSNGLKLGKDKLREVSKAMLTQIVQGKRSIVDGLNVLGAVAAGIVQKNIAQAGAFAPNAQSTIDMKGSSKPLIDTGQLRQSISWAVQSGEGEDHATS